MSKLTEIKSHVACSILELRHKKGWSQQKVADKLKTSRAQVCRLEANHECKASIQTLVKIAKIYRKDLVIEFADRN